MARTEESRPLAASFLWLVALGTFFFLSYNFANRLASQRASVPQVAFGWERNIPFLPWTIVPYWTTDLFYGISFLLCATRDELRVHWQRLLAVQLICVSGFLLFPLRFGFARPHSDGFFGWLFDELAGFDKPFNQAPSLHVALTVVLWAAYRRHLSGAGWWLLRVWFAMMALSTLSTYQHHFIDLPTGLWVGLFVLVAFPDAGRVRFARSTDDRRYWLCAAYAAGAAICGVAAALIGGVGWFLLWCSGALILVAVAYGTGRPELLGKNGGPMSVAAGWILAPYLIGAWASSRLQTRGQAAAQEIADGVCVGRVPGASEFKGSLVSVTAEMPVKADRNVPMLDLLAPGVDQLDAAVRAIQELEGSRPTLVFCALGWSRSAASVAAWLVASGRVRSVADAVEMIRARRPYIVMGPRYIEALERWSAARKTK
jgi:hypothetical protein